MGYLVLINAVRSQQNMSSKQTNDELISSLNAEEELAKSGMPHSNNYQHRRQNVSSSRHQDAIVVGIGHNLLHELDNRDRKIVCRLESQEVHIN